MEQHHATKPNVPMQRCLLFLLLLLGTATLGGCGTLWGLEAIGSVQMSRPSGQKVYCGINVYQEGLIFHDRKYAAGILNACVRACQRNGFTLSESIPSQLANYSNVASPEDARDWIPKVCKEGNQLSLRDAKDVEIVVYHRG